MATEPSLADLVSRWQELRRQGKPAPPEEVCAECPEKVEELKRHLQVLGAMKGFLEAGGTTLEGPDLPPTGGEDPPGGNAEAASLPREIAGYEILGELGRGGMGVVYKARQTRLNRLVALKMILTGVHAGSEQLARLRAEAQVVARLQHPHIVNIYDVGEHQGLPYLALEYVDGGNLAQLLQDLPQQPVRRAAELTATLAAAVEHAHRRGIVHRDLKPANVLLATDGTLKITDFGLAKQLDADTARTASGAILGTPSYIAPEQAGGKGKHIGPATDVYALGAILYECLTGRPPFRAETTLDTLMQVVSEDVVPPSRLRPDCPRALEAICLKCLRKEPTERYAGAAALEDELRHFLAGKPVWALQRPDGQSHGRRPGRRRLVAWALAGSALLLAALALVLLRVSREINKAQGERRVLRTFQPADKPLTQDSVAAEQGGWRIGATEGRTVRLFELPNPGVDHCTVLYRARLKTANVKGQVYLEMWCRFPGHGEHFSRGLPDALTGNNEWTSVETPFLLKWGEVPDLIRLNVVIEGQGTVWVKEVELLMSPLPQQLQASPPFQTAGHAP
jgi:serine/threonine-protein kinase